MQVCGSAIKNVVMPITQISAKIRFLTTSWEITLSVTQELNLQKINSFNINIKNIINL